MSIQMIGKNLHQRLLFLFVFRGSGSFLKVDHSLLADMGNYGLVDLT